MTHANDNFPLVLTRAEAAEMCGISPSGFDNWIRKGIIPPAIIGTRRWSRDAIRDAVNGRSVAVDAALSPYERQKAERHARKA